MCLDRTPLFRDRGEKLSLSFPMNSFNKQGAHMKMNPFPQPERQIVRALDVLTRYVKALKSFKHPYPQVYITMNSREPYLLRVILRKLYSLLSFRVKHNSALFS